MDHISEFMIRSPLFKLFLIPVILKYISTVPIKETAGPLENKQKQFLSRKESRLTERSIDCKLQNLTGFSKAS